MAQKNKLDKLYKKAYRKADRGINYVIKHSQVFLFSRWDHVRLAKRDIVLWLVMMLVLISAGLFQAILYGSQVTTNAPAAGGSYVEGVADKLTTISPLYAKTDTEKAVSQLVYPGLLSYDRANKLHGQLAKSWKMDGTGKIWTVQLKDNLMWSDKTPLTAEDVAYTVKLMKNSDIYTASDAWGSVDVSTKGKYTVEFKLPNALTSFDSALTFGVVPKHILDNKSPLEISTMFSQKLTQVVGSGPYKFDHSEQRNDNSIWYFKPNQTYSGDVPEIANFSIRTYSNNDDLTAGLRRGEVNAISGVNVSNVNNFSENDYNIIQLKTSNGLFALFNNERSMVQDDSVRAALRLGLNRDELRKKVVAGVKNLTPPTKLETPIATGVYNSIDKLTQPAYDVKAASDLLDKAGWKLTDGEKYRRKGDSELALNVVTIAHTNYETVANNIAEQWRKLNIKVNVQAIDSSVAQQNFLIPRNYDVLVYQMHLGADPDMLAYWSSTQATPTGSNLANYKSKRADIALSNGRSNVSAKGREARYINFVNQWLNDSPAIAIYQPSLIYITTKNINSFKTGDSVIDAGNRFNEANNWTANLTPVANTP